MPVDGLDPRGRFMDFGIDSILGGQVVARLNAALGLRLRPTVLFDHPSIRDLARHIEREHGGQIRVAEPAAASPQPVPVIPVVAAPEAKDQRIAVIGLSARFADCPDVASFHAMLAEGRSAISEVPPIAGRPTRPACPTA